jgi:hypothetical protein
MGKFSQRRRLLDALDLGELRRQLHDPHAVVVEDAQHQSAVSQEDRLLQRTLHRKPYGLPGPGVHDLVGDDVPADVAVRHVARPHVQGDQASTAGETGQVETAAPPQGS